MAEDELVKVTVAADVSPYIRETSKAASATAKLGAETDKVTTKAKRAGTAWSAAMRGIDDDIKKVTASQVVAGVSISAFGAKAVHGLTAATQATSDLSESTTKMQQIYGQSAAQIETYASGSAQALGMSKRSALDAASTMATFGKAAGLTGDELVAFSTDMVGLSADLASFFNSSPEQAMEAIGAALRGEAEPIRQYGVLLDDATLRQRAFEMGLISSTKNALTPQQRALAAQKEILAQTADAQGDYARTADGLANTQRRATAELENAKAELGEALLPVLTDATSTAADLMHAYSELPKPLQETATVLMGVVATAALVGPGLYSTYQMIKAGTDAWKAYRTASVEAAAADVAGSKARAMSLADMGKIAAVAAVGFETWSRTTGTYNDQLRRALAETGEITDESAKKAYDSLTWWGKFGQDFKDVMSWEGLKASFNPATDWDSRRIELTKERLQGLKSEQDEAAASAQALADRFTKMGDNAQNAAAGVGSLTASTQAGAQALFGYLGALNAVAGAQLQTAGIGDSLAAHLQSNSTSGSPGSTARARATDGESKALQGKVDAIRKADKAEEDAEVAAAQRRAKRKAEARADAGARRDVQSGVAGAIATDKAARAGKDIDGTNQTRSTGEASGDLTKAEQKALDRQIEGIRARHKKSVDGQVKALGEASKGQQSMATATDNASRSLDINTESGRKNLEWLQQQAGAALQVGQTIYDAAIKRDESEEEAGRKAGRAILDYRQKLVDAMTQAGFSRDAVLKYLKTLGLTPKQIKTQFLIEVDTQAFEDAIAGMKSSVRDFAKWLHKNRPDLSVGEVRGIAAKTDRYNNAQTAWASGGYVTGAGSKTSDSIAARLSHGEYVMRAAAVDHYGPGFMDSVNARSFAGGGPVSPRTFYGTARSGSSSVTHGPSYGMYLAPGAITVTEATPNRMRVATMDMLAEQAYRRGVVR